MDLSGKLIKGAGSFAVQEIAAPIGQVIPYASSKFNTDGTGWYFAYTSSLLWNSATEDMTITATGVNFGVRISSISSGLKFNDRVRIRFRAKGDSNKAFDLGNDLDMISKEVNPVMTSEYQWYDIIGHIKRGDGDLYLYVLGAEVGKFITIDDVTIEGIPEGYPLLDKGNKYLRCSVNGNVAFKSNQAYGEWEFDYYKKSDTSTSYINFINDRISGSYRDFIGYNFYVTSTEALFVRYHAIGTNANIMYTGADYIELNTWYRIKITRTLDNEFKLYIKGGDFGVEEWTLVDVSGGGGSNPGIHATVITSSYISLEFDAGDKIGNIKTRKTVRQ